MKGSLRLNEETGDFSFITEDNQVFEVNEDDTLDYFVEVMARSQKMSKNMGDLPLMFNDYLFKNHYKLVGSDNVRNIKTNKVVSIGELYTKFWNEFVDNKLGY